MRRVVSLICALSLSLGAAALNPNLSKRSNILKTDQICRAIQKVISNSSAVYYPSDVAYAQDILHWMDSSTQDSMCTVEPGTVGDVSNIIKVLANSAAPFGVKCGGHASNQGFSSTSGVLIAMARFNQVVYHPETNTVDIPTGITWDDVYETLDPYNVNVVGGRVSGIGATGFMLGGGYSWLTNLHGLTVDTLVAVELVLPNGAVIEVTESAFPDLFFGLKGGFNNFGIVTKFTLQTFPQTKVWAGIIIYDGQEWDALADAIVNFQATNMDPNANVLPTLNVQAGGAQSATLLVFYNNPNPPSGLFDRFLNIPSITNTVSTRSFLDFILSLSSPSSDNLRGAFMTVSLANISSEIVQTIISEAKTWAAYNQKQSGVLVSYDIEPFLTSIPHHATRSAYPHEKYASPLNLWFAWTLATADSYQLAGIKQSATNIAAAAKAQGQDIESLALYPNYCLADTPLEKMYGQNLASLKMIKDKYDPSNVMGRAGGFKF